MDELFQKIRDMKNEILDLLVTYNPEPKTYIVRCRMKYLAFLAYRIVSQITEAGTVADFDSFRLLYEKFKKEFQRISKL